MSIRIFEYQLNIQYIPVKKLYKIQACHGSLDSEDSPIPRIIQVPPNSCPTLPDAAAAMIEAIGPSNKNYLF